MKNIQLKTMKRPDFHRSNNCGGVCSEKFSEDETSAILHPINTKNIGSNSLLLGLSNKTMRVTIRFITIDKVANIPTTEVGKNAKATKSRTLALALSIKAIRNIGRKQTLVVNAIGRL